MRRYNVFLASPGDTRQDRDDISILISEYNSRVSDGNIMFNLLKWETDAAAGAGHPQERINENLLSRSDILICVFWKQYYSDNSLEVSNTALELQWFSSKGLPFVVYFIDREWRTSLMKNTADLEQIINLRTSLSPKHTTRNVNSFKENADLFYKELLELANKCESIVPKNRLLDETDAVETLINNDKSKKNWYEISITEHILAQLEENGLGDLRYNRAICFRENVELWSAMDQNFRSDDLLNTIRQTAFDRKYGSYNYDNDLRSKYPNTWHSFITPYLRDAVTRLSRISIAAMAANSGEEIDEIINKTKLEFNLFNISVVDLSYTAVARGKLRYPNFNFKTGNMEKSPLGSDAFDIYINLRSIHSNGVDAHKTLIDCKRMLRKDGIAILSISDGYIRKEIDKSSKIMKGMYDNRLKSFSPYEPMNIAHKIHSILIDYEFKDVGIHQGDTEIFLVGRK